jgi:riboflavin kinase/FMN adenylyltransferase
VIRGFENFKPLSEVGAVATVGTFDGIHRGHQEIFRRVASESSRMGMEPVLITFHPHPRVVVTPENIPLLLTTIEEKEIFLKDFYAGQVLLLEFNDQLKQMTAEEFVKKILVDTVHARKMIVGYDHALGKNRSGDVVELTKLGQKYGFEVEVVGPIMDDSKPISSTRVRKALQENRLQEAIRLLGHGYAIAGNVERGIGLGHKIGYPTANVNYSARKLLPAEGVYSCWAQIGDTDFDGMMFIGRNHFNPQERISVEANLFDVDEDLYGQQMIVYPTHYIRENRRFESTDDLVRQIEHDKQEILRIIDKEKKNAS